MLRPHPAYQSNSRAVPIGMLLNLQGHIRPVGHFTCTQMAISAPLAINRVYWALACHVRPQFQHVLSIRHRCARRVKPRQFEPIRESCIGWKGGKIPEGQTENYEVLK